MRLLGSTAVGRVGFTSRALPDIRPVTHLIDAGHVIIRSDRDSAITGAATTERGAVVAYEADNIDPASGSGWSVLIVGLARLIEDSQEAARYREMLPSLVSDDAASVIRIYPELVTGFELTEEDAQASAEAMPS